MRLFSWNVNGIRAVVKKGALQDFIAKYQPDVLCLQEIKISLAQVEELRLKEMFGEYEQFYTPAERAGYAGTAVWVKKAITRVGLVNGFSAEILQEYPDLSNDKYGDATDEGRLTGVELEDFYVISTYVPNAKEDLSRLGLRQKDWDPALLQLMLQLDEKKPVVICGDFNVAHAEIDLANPKQNKGKHGFTDEERAGFGNFIKAGFLDTFRFLHPTEIKYSWWSHWARSRERNIGWRIDYFLASKKLEKRILKADICAEIMGSDHCPVSLELG